MRVGILNAIIGREEVNWNDTPVDAYVRFFESAGAPFDFIGYEVGQGEFPNSADECDAYVITGSPSGAYDPDEWVGALSEFIQTSFQQGKKLVGICFGHQILSHALGGRAEKSEKGWGLGLHSFSITTTKSWMNGKPEQCSLYFVHQDQVVTLPPEAERLGGNDFCPNAIFAIEDRVLGIQGHPTPAIMQEILPLVEARTEPQTYARALRSLKSGLPDNKLMAQWVVNFLLTGSEKPKSERIELSNAQ